MISFYISTIIISSNWLQAIIYYDYFEITTKVFAFAQLLWRYHKEAVGLRIAYMAK